MFFGVRVANNFMMDTRTFYPGLVNWSEQWWTTHYTIESMGWDKIWLTVRRR